MVKQGSQKRQAVGVLPVNTMSSANGKCMARGAQSFSVISRTDGMVKQGYFISLALAVTPVTSTPDRPTQSSLACAR